MKQKSFKFYLRLSIGMFILITLSLFIFDNITEMKEADAMNEQYPLITKNSYIHGVVVNKIDNKDSLYYKGETYLELNNHEQFSLFGLARNKSYRESNLDEFINIGDSINKRSGKNDIYIYRNGKEYHFVLGEIIE